MDHRRFLSLTIIVGHALEEGRGYGWTAQDVSPALGIHLPSRRYIDGHRVRNIDLCRDLVPAQKSHAVLRRAVLGVLNWGENELKSRAFFGGFLKTIDWWQWAAIDASVATLVAILLKPVVHKLARREAGVKALSIADLFLATLATSILILATRSIATLPASPNNPEILFCGWPQTVSAV